MANILYSIQLPSETWEAVEQAATEDGISVSSWVESVVDATLNLPKIVAAWAEAVRNAPESHLVFADLANTSPSPAIIDDPIVYLRQLVENDLDDLRDFVILYRDEGRPDGVAEMEARITVATAALASLDRKD